MLTVKLQYLLRLIELVELIERDSYNPGIRIQGNFDVSTVLVFIWYQMYSFFNKNLIYSRIIEHLKFTIT